MAGSGALTERVFKAVKHVAKKVVKAAKKIGTAVKKAAKATANFVKQHASTIVSVAVGVAVFAGCTALTAGVGAIGCAALAGAAANGVGYMMSDGPKTLAGFGMAVGVGAVTGALGGAAGGLASGAVGRLLAGVGGKALQGGVMGASGGAAEGAVGYGVSCVNSQEGCSVGGAATASAVGAATGGVFGAAAGKWGPKSKQQRQADDQPGAPRPTQCRVPTPHSFTGATAVLLANGTTKPIAEVKAGDYVLTAEPGKKEKEKHRVKEVIVTKTDRDYVDVVVATKDGPKTIQTTKHHQFYESTQNAWTQAGDLKAGQQLQNGDGVPTAIVEVNSYTAERVTYDLSVEGLHTYHVLAGDTPVLVHNDDPLPTQVAGRNQPLTNKQATDLAKYLKYTKTNFKMRGQLVFTDKKKQNYITQDIGNGDGSHNGGTWKIAGSVEALGQKTTRTATTDALLTPIGC